ncbi:MAG: rod shape-determining protein MreD [Phycisphaerae bacterium]
MRWLLLAILAYVLLVAQVTLFVPGALAVPVHGHWVRPDLVLLVGVFVALYFEPRQTFPAACCFGLALDLAAVTGRLGIHALLFTAVLTGLSTVRGVLNRRWIMTQSVVAFGVVLVVHAAGYMAARYLGGGPVAPLRSLEEAALDAVYSGVLAPYVIWGLLRLRGPLGVTVEPGEI